MMPHVPTMQGTSSSHGMAAAPAKQHTWACDLMHTVGETQRTAQQTQQRVGAPDLQQNSISRQHRVSLVMHPMHPSPQRQPSYVQQHASMTRIALLSRASPSPSPPIAPSNLWEAFSPAPN